MVLFYHCMIFLKRTYMNTLAGKLCLDTLCGSSCSCNGGDIRHVVLDSVLADIGIAHIILLGAGSINYQVYLTVLDGINDIGTSLEYLVNTLTLNTCFLDLLIGGAGSEDLESVICEALGDGKQIRLIIVVDTDEYCSGKRKLCLGSFFCLVECLANILRKSEDLTGGTHLGSEKRIDLREHIEGEYRLLDSVIRDYSVLKLRYG